MDSGSDAGSSHSDEDNYSDAAVIIDTSSEGSDGIADDSTTADLIETSSEGEFDRESKTSTDDDGSLVNHPASRNVEVIDSDDGLHPMEQMPKRRRTTATLAPATALAPAQSAWTAPEISEARCMDPPTRRLRDKTVPETGLSPGEVYVLKCFRVPAIFWHILAMLHWRLFAGASNAGASKGDIDGCEYFAGQAEVTKALRRRGFASYAYDIKYARDLMDMCDPIGFLYAIVLCLRVKAYGICWFGTVCSSWVWIAKATCVRTLHNPRGDTRVPAVAQGNCQATRSCLLMVMCYVRQITWILEQPSSSRMFTHPAMVWARERAHAMDRVFHIISTYQGAFGAETSKKTILASNSKCTHGLVRPNPGASNAGASKVATARVTSVREDGRRMVTGTAELKGTQAYSREFGEAVAETFADESFFNSLGPGHSGIIGYGAMQAEAWCDAALESVASCLRDGSPRLLERLATLPRLR